MIKIEINNKQKMELHDDVERDCLKLKVFDNKGNQTEGWTIEYGEFVMLMNYFRNCKNGDEVSDYIK